MEKEIMYEILGNILVVSYVRFEYTYLALLG